MNQEWKQETFYEATEHSRLENGSNRGNDLRDIEEAETAKLEH